MQKIDKIIKILKKKESRFLLVILFLTALVLYSPQTARAAEVITGFGDGILRQIIGVVLDTVRGWIFALISALGGSLNAVLTLGVNEVPVVEQSWGIIRNFANMLFIVGLVVMAFGTIFNVAGYELRSLITRFLIAALLVNFSLAIGYIVIDISQSLSNIFIQSMGDVGARIAQGVKIGELVGGQTEATTSSGGLVQNTISIIRAAAILGALGPGAQIGTGIASFLQSTPADNIAWALNLVAFMDIILGMILVFALGVAFFFTIIRIPILWALLIVSPIAWACSVLPSTRKVHQRWWRYFIGWNVFLPVYLFFLYFGSLFLSQGNNVATQIFQSEDRLTLVSGMGIQFQTLFFYILVALFMIGGAKMAMSWSMTAGAGGVAAGIWARGRTAARFTAMRTPIPYIGSLEAARRAGKEKLGELQQKGLPGRMGYIYGGEEGLQRQRAVWAQRFGVRDAKDKQLAKDIELAKNRQFNRMDVGQLETYIQTSKGKAPNYEYLAALETLRERRGLNGDQIKEAYGLYGGEASENARKFLERVDINSLSRDDRNSLYNLETGIPNQRFRQKINEIRAQRGDFESSEEWAKYFSGFTLEGDKVEFIKKSKDYLENILRKDQRQAIFAGIRPEDKEAQRAMAMIMASKGDFDLRDKREIEKLVGGDGVEGLFTTDSDKIRFLDAIEKKKIIQALRAKEMTKGSDGKSLLRDKDGNETTFQKALEIKAQKIPDEDLLELDMEEFIKGMEQEFTDKTTSKVDEKGYREFVSKIFTPNRIKRILINPKASATKINQMQGLFELGRKRSLVETKLNPLKARLTRAQFLANQIIKLEPTIENRRKIEETIQTIDGIMVRSEKELKQINQSEFADEEITSEAQQEINKTKEVISRAKSKHGRK